ncbi:Uncharacterized protein APZ42_014662 [Daphnia magna]|uniref:Uncharacterized protein n=1 Tax=Daphnia magna TaxID=35525 RepID=A0A162PPI9_9CRUS|nr:Uncharacterized protein APZ42_014662 [Daphnia magna]
MIYPMSCINEDKFQKAFESTMITFRRFLEKNGDKGGQKWPEGAKMDLAVKKYSLQLTLCVQQAAVGKNVDSDYSGVNSSAIVFFNGNSLHSMLIIVGSSCNVNYKNINVSSRCVVVLNLLSVYYGTDCNYPAMYGVLSLIDRMCLNQEGFPRQKPVQKDSMTMASFLKKYDKFVFDDDQDQQAQELPSDEEST